MKNIRIIRMNWYKHLFFTFSFFDIFWYMFEEVRRQGNKCIFSQLIISNGINVTYCYTPWVNVLITQRVKMCWRVRGIRPCARWTNLFLLFYLKRINSNNINSYIYAFIRVKIYFIACYKIVYIKKSLFSYIFIV